MMRFDPSMCPPAAPIRPHRSLIAFFALMKNKEDTSQVIRFSTNLNGKLLHRTFERWMSGPNAKLLIDEDPEAILKAFDDRDRLRALPVGTVGRTYAEFMDREGLDTDGVAQSYRDKGVVDDELLASFHEFSAFTWFLNLTHDMYHILTGYNRDSLGEAAVLNFTTQITKNRGIKYLAALASYRIKAEAPDVPVFKVMTNARRMGQASADLLHVDFVSMLDRPLREVREELNIVPDPVYAALPQERLLALVQPQAA